LRPSTATQFVVEEKIMSRYEVEPLMAVGLEGFFGALSIGILLPIVLALFPLGDADSTYARYFDVRRNWKQMVNTPAVLWTSLAIMCSISLFNLFVFAPPARRPLMACAVSGSVSPGTSARLCAALRIRAGRSARMCAGVVCG
jgi:hypothetical protein